jgi:hypothetical protein
MPVSRFATKPERDDGRGFYGADRSATSPPVACRLPLKANSTASTDGPASSDAAIVPVPEAPAKVPVDWLASTTLRRGDGRHGRARSEGAILTLDLDDEAA